MSGGEERKILSIWFPARVASGRNVPNAERDAACAEMRERARRDIGREPTGEVARVRDEEIAKFRRIVAKWNRR